MKIAFRLRWPRASASSCSLRPTAATLTPLLNMKRCSGTRASPGPRFTRCRTCRNRCSSVKSKSKARSKPKSKARSKPKPKSTNGTAGMAALREHLAYLLKGGGAHVHLADALEGFPEVKRGAFAPGLRHTGWQLLEHVRIAQWDILEFSRNPEHVSPEFPEGYWPKTPGPVGEEEWNKTVEAFQRDLKEMIKLVENPRTDLYAKIAHGQGQNILREALV